MTDHQEQIEHAARRAMEEHQVAAYGQSSVDGWFCKARGCNWEMSGHSYGTAKEHVADAVAAAVQQTLSDAGMLKSPDDDDMQETYSDLCSRQYQLLTGAVNALRGDPPELTVWSHHDVAGLAQAMKDRAEKAEAERDRLQADLAKVLTDGIPTPTAEGPHELTGDLARDMAAYAMRLKDRLEKAERQRDEWRTDAYVVGHREVTAERDRLRADLAKGEASDGYHTHNELYEYRMLYNAALFNEWARHDREKPFAPLFDPRPRPCKSWNHSDGQPCFGGGWFIVVTTLPTGQISNHYKAEHWDLFQIPDVETPPEYDGHTPEQAAQRLREFLEQA